MTDSNPVKNNTSIQHVLNSWHVSAIQNVDKWGLQNIESLIIVTDEEWGEFTQAYHESTYESEGGEPLDKQKSLEECTEKQLDRIEDELEDTAALLVQIQATIDQSRHT